jgi:hypothetical protein
MRNRNIRSSYVWFRFVSAVYGDLRRKPQGKLWMCGEEYDSVRTVLRCSEIMRIKNEKLTWTQTHARDIKSNNYSKFSLLIRSNSVFMIILHYF